MAKAFRSDPITVSDRVVARRTFKCGGHSDVIGHVVAIDPLTIRPQMVGGFPSQLPEVVIPAEELYVVKKLSPRTVRNSDIRTLRKPPPSPISATPTSGLRTDSGLCAR